MKEFESKVDVLESKYGYRKELEELKKNVQELENQKLTLEKNPDKARHLLEGKCESDLKQELQKLDDEKRQLRGQLLDKEKQVKALNLQQEKTKQETQVLRKRNAAQMTRLKRQLKEVTSRNRQWNEQASQLEKGIAELKKKLQDDH
ncbi:uncharacterized protein LOC106167370 [Lingula anatina]|uniref:Uncharacterized protein LOC106167370 n=1 Tax=Lingula anatina TaxID=7574 RepID=A0A1S3IVM0_LINAN|nr:uncharacterized protein LOC106167370 [Lingula anatina]XP_013401589.1 uncharacterized protein LOC106167370 [Lingula anatina]XP_013401591.1 uncharacterized protein LOC106167370 [Lingula anatina]XP_013401592.1 uncharacterized protein LOC106167370 [Lingula anatina]XP_013401593.1 uncharacterized protein LOC106167370 [Lingula anatina]XP_013401594.1 uncharacterized protein LOC106167370 [Lingula anatina]XP_013401595.1 uncharacterized protein LOC106167370 [Lingula anatina]|eukprot:XP_013401588.1 uncharacterized protein LOC106167370 [Lingula anatina]